MSLFEVFQNLKSFFNETFSDMKQSFSFNQILTLTPLHYLRHSLRHSIQEIRQCQQVLENLNLF